MESIVYKDQSIVVGGQAERVMHQLSDVNRLIEACFEHGSTGMVLYPENLTAEFFDLSTRHAGEVLQKLRNYRIRLAILRTPTLDMSSRFGELLADEADGPHFRMFERREDALAWLGGA